MFVVLLVKGAMLRSRSLACFVALAFVGAAQIGAAQSKTAAGVADQFVTAWNTHDMAAFTRLFTKDAVWVPVAETMDKGRDAVIKDLTLAHTTWAKTTEIRHEEVTVLPVTSNVSTLFFHLHFVVEGKVVPELDRAMILVVKKQAGKWVLAAGQLTKQHDGA